MAKSGPAHTLFISGEQYLARLIMARWTSLPTIIPDEYGLAIQLKLNVLTTVPTTGEPTLCGREACLYIHVRMDATTSTETRIGPTARRIFNDLGILWPQYPSHGSPLTHNERAIICEFGQADPVNGYQSLQKWYPAPDNVVQSLIAQATINCKPHCNIIGLEFPSQLVIKRDLIERKVRSLRDWYMLRLLAGNYNYNGIALLDHACEIVGKSPPDNKEDTIYGTISRLKPILADLGLVIINDRNMNYSLTNI